jgi:hypothetical protein
MGRKRFDKVKQEAGFFRRRRGRSRYWRRGKKRGKGWGKSWSGRDRDRWRKNRLGNKRLSRRDARGWRREDFMRQRGAFAKMRLVGEEVAVESRLGRGGAITRALTKDMASIATSHATRKATRISALEVGGRVNREATRLNGRVRLVSLHRLLGRRKKGASESRRTEGRKWRRGNIKRSGEGSSMLQLAINSFCDEFFLITKKSVLTNSSGAEATESIKLG